MKKFVLNLIKYNVETEKFVNDNGQRRLETIKEEYPLRKVLSDMLRTEGVHSSGAEFFDACELAKQIRETANDFLELSEIEGKLLQRVVDHFVSRKVNPDRPLFVLGGAIHEELIRRVVKMKEV